MVDMNVRNSCVDNSTRAAYRSTPAMTMSFFRTQKSILLLGTLCSFLAVHFAPAQSQLSLGGQLYLGLTITGAVGTVYSIEYVTEAGQTNACDWRCLGFLQSLASPYLWIDKSAPATGHRFYRAVALSSPTNMVFIPAGTFRMGSSTNEVGGLPKEGPQTEVTISKGFWMGKHLVTQGEYLELMGNNPSFFSADNGFTLDLTRPVDSVSWFDATYYCAQLTDQERAAGRIPTNSLYRLPTEAEWEYACRAWTSTRFGYGDDPGYTNLTDYAWYFENSGSMTHPVGQKLPNLWGLDDMHGNLEEWCQDWFGFYLGGRAIDPQGPAAGSLRVLRGGYWEDNAIYCRSASRNQHDPEARHYHIGFRVLLAPGP
jgi:formylglycine-generating enzyme required for sulfatase activity